MGPAGYFSKSYCNNYLYTTIPPKTLDIIMFEIFQGFNPTSFCDPWEKYKANKYSQT